MHKTYTKMCTIPPPYIWGAQLTCSILLYILRSLRAPYHMTYLSLLTPTCLQPSPLDLSTTTVSSSDHTQGHPSPTGHLYA